MLNTWKGKNAFRHSSFLSCHMTSLLFLLWLFLWTHKARTHWNLQTDHNHCQQAFTSSVIGHHQKVVVVDVKGLPVHSRVRLQRLVLQETPSPSVPPIHNWQLRFHLPGVCHHQKKLQKNQTDSKWLWWQTHPGVAHVTLSVESSRSRSLWV